MKLPFTNVVAVLAVAAATATAQTPAQTRQQDLKGAKAVGQRDDSYVLPY